MHTGGRVYPIAREGVALPEFGEEQGQPIINQITLDLATARTKAEIEIGGNFLWAISATDGVANADIAFSRQTADQGLKFKTGTRLSGLKFSRLFITNTAQAGKSITLAYAVEEGRVGLRIDNPAGDFSAVTLTKPTGSTMPVDLDVAAAVDTTIPANTARRRLIVESDINNAGDLRVGVIATDTRGLVLTPGAQQDIFTTEAIVVRSVTTNGASTVWRWFDEED